MEEIDVPQDFLCPISLEIMKDPVTVSTGITYDRPSIEEWLFAGKNNTCPVTKQVLSPDCELTPNHTLRRLIQYWCTLNASYGIERIPTPKPPINKAQISKLIRDAKSSPQLLVTCVRRLRSIAAENETNKRCLEAGGAVDFLASIVLSNSCFVSFEESTEEGFDFTRLREEALSILCNLQLSDVGLKNLMNKNGDFVESLTQIMKLGTFESRAYAVVLLKSMLEAEVADPIQLINLSPQFFIEIIQILRDQISQQASVAALQTLVHILPWGRNRVKAVEAGAVSILIDLLLEKSDRRDCELILMTVDFLCQCADGRAELLKHWAGMAIISKKILRVSQMASDRAMRILLSISKFSATPGVLQEMLQLGVVAKLCLVLQVECSNKTKDKAREILKMHARAWKNSPCIPNTLIGSYPEV